MFFKGYLGWPEIQKFALVTLLAFQFSTATAAEPRDYAVEISAQVLSNPLSLELRWPRKDYARQYTVRRRLLGSGDWGSPVATLPPASEGFTDANVSNGIAYEYEVQLETTIGGGAGLVSAYGYIYAGMNVPAADYKGKVIMVVDSSIAGSISGELANYERNLIGAGWSVVRRDVSRSASPVEVRNVIRGVYGSDPYNVRSVVLIGHVPVPYSGDIAPDLHASHRGAWPADVYYGEMDGTWTDSVVNITSQDSDDNHNYPGDGKFDQSQIPSSVELEVGRIDFWNLPAFAPRTEVDLLRVYFRKNHEFRHRLANASRRGLIRDNFDDLNGDAPAVDAWRHYSPFFGAGNVREVGFGQFFPTLAGESFLWAYGAGGGGFTKADGIGTTSDFAASDPKAVFLILHGSYFGDWNGQDNFLRAAVATPNYSLASIWSGLPHWFLHPMALGATVGYCTKLTQNNLSNYKSYQNFSPQQVHISLIGDPTLEMFPVLPPSNLSGSAGGTVNLNWSPSSDESLVGYHVYHSLDWNGPFQRVTGSPVTGTSFSHPVAEAGTHRYMVRAIKLERTGSGTFLNASQGVFTEVTTSGGGTSPPVVSGSVVDADASEAGSNPGVFKISRSPVGESPLTVDFILGGSAQNGGDYSALGSSVIIPAGSTEAMIVVTPYMDQVVEGDENVTLRITAKTSYGVGNALASLTIKDAYVNQAPTISVIARQEIVAGEGTGEIPFQVNDPETAQSLLVRAVSSNTNVVAAGGITLGGSGINRTVRIVPVPGAVGETMITIMVSDGSLESSTTFEVVVMPVNLPPTANSQNVGTSAGQPVAILLIGQDPEGVPLEYSISATPTNGVLSGTPPSMIYSPAAGFTGMDGFSFVVGDGKSQSAPAQVSINVLPVNRPPVAEPQTVTCTEDGSISIILTGLDPDEDPLEFQLVTGPTRGIITGRGANYQYTPGTNLFGQDNFSFTVSDGVLMSETAVVLINVTPANDPPTATNSLVTVVEDGSIQITLNGSDVDGDVLAYGILAEPTKGQLTGIPPAIIYTPDADVNGSDLFTWTITDSNAEPVTVTVTIEIQPRNDPPEISAIPEIASRKNTNLSPARFSVYDRDLPVSAPTVEIKSSNEELIRPEKVIIKATGTNFLVTIMPETNSIGSSTMTVMANDGEATNQTTFLVTITNTPPVAEPDTVASSGGVFRMLESALLKNDFDADGDTLHIVSASASALGRNVTVEDGVLLYDGGAAPAADSFEYTVEDTSGEQAKGLVRIQIQAEPAIEEIVPEAAGRFVLRFHGPANAPFQVQASTDARSWVMLGEGSTDQTGKGQYEDSTGNEVNHRFYRVEWP